MTIEFHQGCGASTTTCQSVPADISRYQELRARARKLIEQAKSRKKRTAAGKPVRATFYIL